MTTSIVDVLEMVEIDEQDRAHAVVALCARQQQRQAVEQQAPVRQLGQCIEERQPVDVLFSLDAVRDVAQNHAADRVAVGIRVDGGRQFDLEMTAVGTHQGQLAPGMAGGSALVQHHLEAWVAFDQQAIAASLLQLRLAHSEDAAGCRICRQDRSFRRGLQYAVEAVFEQALEPVFMHACRLLREHAFGNVLYRAGIQDRLAIRIMLDRAETVDPAQAAVRPHDPVLETRRCRAGQHPVTMRYHHRQIVRMHQRAEGGNAYRPPGRIEAVEAVGALRAPVGSAAHVEFEETNAGQFLCLQQLLLVDLQPSHHARKSRFEFRELPARRRCRRNIAAADCLALFDSPHPPEQVPDRLRQASLCEQQRQQDAGQ